MHLPTRQLMPPRDQRITSMRRTKKTREGGGEEEKKRASTASRRKQQLWQQSSRASARRAVGPRAHGGALREPAPPTGLRRRCGRGEPPCSSSSPRSPPFMVCTLEIFPPSPLRCSCTGGLSYLFLDLTFEPQCRVEFWPGLAALQWDRPGKAPAMACVASPPMAMTCAGKRFLPLPHGASSCDLPARI